MQLRGSARDVERVQPGVRASTARTASTTASGITSVRVGEASTWQWWQAWLQRLPTFTCRVVGAAARSSPPRPGRRRRKREGIARRRHIEIFLSTLWATRPWARAMPARSEAAACIASGQVLHGQALLQRRLACSCRCSTGTARPGPPRSPTDDFLALGQEAGLEGGGVVLLEGVPRSGACCLRSPKWARSASSK